MKKSFSLPRRFSLLSHRSPRANTTTRNAVFRAVADSRQRHRFLGNSITDGGEWAELFNNRHVKNRGISADRSGWLLDRLDPIINGHPKKLFLMIGTNDLAVGIAPEEVAANVENCSTVSPRSRRGRRSTCRASFP